MSKAAADVVSSSRSKSRFQFSLISLFVLTTIVAVTAALPELTRYWFLFGVGLVALGYAGYRLRLPIHHELLGNKLMASGDHLGAIAEYSTSLRHHADRPAALLNRARCNLAVGKLEDAVSDASAASLLLADWFEAFFVLGEALFSLGLYSLAIEHFSQAVKSDDFKLAALARRAQCFQKLGDWARAAVDYDRLLMHGETGHEILNNAAWFWATCPDGKFRDGPRAVQLAKVSCEKSQCNMCAYLDTLAAAYAETKEFGLAIQTEQQALELAPADKIGEFTRCLNLYRAGVPYRAAI